MKKLVSFYLICTLSFFLSCNGNKINASDVPKPTIDAFTAKYPGATDIGWITEKKGDKTIYEAKFKFIGKEIEAEFNADGTFIQED